MADYNWFTKNKLVSSSFVKLLPEFQVTQTTTGAAQSYRVLSLSRVMPNRSADY